MKNFTIIFSLIALLSCSQKQSSFGNGNSNDPKNCFTDISECDISGTYALSNSDVAALYIYSSQIFISQKSLPMTELAISPNFTFYTGAATYIFRSVGSGIWDGDSLHATIHGKLRNNVTGYPIVGGFSVTLNLDAKTKTLTTAYYYNANIMRLPIPALDGEIVLADSAHVMFPVTNNKARVILTQF